MADTLRQLCEVMQGHAPHPENAARCMYCGTPLQPGTVTASMRERTPRRLRLAVCQVLGNRAGFGDFWGDMGPTEPAARFLAEVRSERARELLDTVGAHDAAHVLLAWLVWDGSGLEELRELLPLLCKGVREELERCARAVAEGAASVELWLAVEGVRHA